MFFPVHDQNNKAVTIIPFVSYSILALCIIVFLYQQILIWGDPTLKSYVNFLYTHAMVPKAYLDGRATYYIPTLFTKLAIHNSWLGLQLMPITSIFMHNSIMHITGNMWFFWIFADNVEERFGPFLFALFFLTTGVVSSFGYLLLKGSVMTPLLGASGSISGVMGAYLVFFPHNRITTYFCPIWFFIRRIDVSSLIVTGMFFLFNILSMTETTSHRGVTVAFSAHVTGFISGLILAYIFKLIFPVKTQTKTLK